MVDPRVLQETARATGDQYRIVGDRVNQPLADITAEKDAAVVQQVAGAFDGGSQLFEQVSKSFHHEDDRVVNVVLPLGIVGQRVLTGGLADR